MGVNYETVGDFYVALGEGLRALVAHCGEASASMAIGRCSSRPRRSICPVRGTSCV